MVYALSPSKHIDMKQSKRILAILAAIFCLTAIEMAAAPKQMVFFTHKKHPELYSCTMKLSKLGVLKPLLPAELKREIGEEYYPAMREGLLADGKSTFKDGKASITYVDEDRFDLKMEFPLFYLDFTNLTWKDMDRLFEKLSK